MPKVLTSLSTSLGYYPAQLKISDTSGWRIVYYVENPNKKGQMKRFVVKVNRIKNKNERRRYANNLIKEINHRLQNGLNPLLLEQASTALKKLPPQTEHLNNSINALINIINQQNEVLDDSAQLTMHECFKSIDSKLRRELSPESYKDYCTPINGLKKYLVENEIDQVPANQFDQKKAMNWLYTYGDLNELSNNGINQLKIKASAMMSRVVDEGLIKTNPFFGIKKLKEEEREINLWDLDDLKKFLKFTKENHPNFYIGALMVLQVYIRPTELLRIRKEHLILNKGIVMVKVKKGVKYKTEPGSLSSELVEIISTIKYEMLPNDYLFSRDFNFGGKPLSKDVFNRTFKRIKEKLKFRKPNVKFYDLKHTGVTIMAEKGIPLQKIQKQCRHTSISTTEKYVGRLTRMADENYINFPEF